MNEKWTRDKWLANEAEFNRRAEVIAAFVKAVKAHRDGYEGRCEAQFGGETRCLYAQQRDEHRALLAALKLAEERSVAEPMRKTVPPDTVSEVVDLLPKVATHGPPQGLWPDTVAGQEFYNY